MLKTLILEHCFQGGGDALFQIVHQTADNIWIERHSPLEAFLTHIAVQSAAILSSTKHGTLLHTSAAVVIVPCEFRFAHNVDTTHPKNYHRYLSTHLLLDFSEKYLSLYQQDNGRGIGQF